MIEKPPLGPTRVPISGLEWLQMSTEKRARWRMVERGPVNQDMAYYELVEPTMPKHPIANMVDELARQAVMKFRAEDIARVQRTAQRITRGEKITIECPLPVWDSESMGVAFKRVLAETINGKRHRMKRTASFVLTQDEMENEVIVAQKCGIALAAIKHNVLSQVREERPDQQEKPNERSDQPSAQPDAGSQAA